MNNVVDVIGSLIFVVIIVFLFIMLIIKLINPT